MTSPARSSEDERFWTVLDASLIGIAVSKAAKAFDAARRESRVATWLQASRAVSPLQARRLAGVAAIAGAIVHVLLAWQRAPIGLWWLILPAIALTFGVTAVLMSSGAARR